MRPHYVVGLYDKGDYWTFKHDHRLEWQFYAMWAFTNLLLAGLFYVAVEHL